MREIQGKPLIKLLFERLSRAQRPERVLLCTSHHSSDDELCSFAKTEGLQYFRGSLEDVLERYNQAMQLYQPDIIVNVDGDDVLCDPTLVDQTVLALEDRSVDCVAWRNLPFGVSPLGFTSDALQSACKMKKTVKSSTGWGRFFTESGRFNVQFLEPQDPHLRRPDIRLTVDYEDDLRLVRKIYENLREPFSLSNIITLLETKPELLRINESVKNLYWQHFTSEQVTL